MLITTMQAQDWKDLDLHVLLASWSLENVRQMLKC